MTTATLTLSRSSLDLADARFKSLKGPIDADLMWEVFCGIPEGIDRYLVLRDLLTVAPKVYYQLLLRHTETILPFIYTVRTRSIEAVCSWLSLSCVGNRMLPTWQ